MRTIRCPLCSAAAAHVVVRIDYNLTGAAGSVYQVVECARCRFRYLNPRPEAEELAGFYEADYPAHALQWQPDAPPTPEQASLNRRFERITRHRLALVNRLIPKRLGSLRVLDIGFGNGAFLLELLHRHDAETWGLDTAAGAVAELARRDRRLRLTTGDVHRANLPEGYFDLVTLWHALEHDGDPVGVLERARQLLRPGGSVLAEVPDSGGAIAQCCGRHWLGWDLPRHLVHFSAASLRATARRAGLNNVRVLRQYTLNPLTLSPLLASAVLWGRRRRGRRRMKRLVYHRWDGLGGVLLRLVNGIERFLGGNGLLLAARAPLEGSSRCAA